MKKLVFSLLVLLAGTVFSYAAEIDGKWKGTFGAPGGGEGMELTFSFKADGEKLTGSITTQMGDMEFTNGKISGKEFSFDVDMQGMVIKHKGTIDGDTIKMKVEGFGAPEGGDGGPAQEPMILKRVKQ